MVPPQGLFGPFPIATSILNINLKSPKALQKTLGNKSHTSILHLPPQNHAFHFTSLTLLVLLVVIVLLL
ncbi:hypothetical protein DL95DRAFT_382574 [Leptodontidium sp. 2 PMI_412]|nr:hypothetical protein DL95DRAFT_382574 [Leptodontidium sp. 2 PMI_412]